MKYLIDTLYRYQSNKNIDMIAEGVNSTQSESKQSLEQYIDFIFILRNKSFEINENIQKYYFSGYIGIINITINNGTENNLILFDKNLS